MEKRFTGFDESVKSAMEGYEFSYDSGSWNAFEKQLNAQAGNKGKYRNLFLVAASGLVLLTLWWLIPTEQLSDNRQGRLALRANLVNPEQFAGVGAYSSKMRGGVGSNSNSEPLSQTAQIESIPSGQLQNSNKVEASEGVAEKNSGKSGMAKAESMELVLMPTKREACVSEIVGFGINIHYTGAEKFLWNFGDGTFSNQPDPSHKYAKPGTYDVSLSITSTTDGVIRSRVMERLVVIYPKPDAKFDWEFLNKSHEPTRVKFVNKSESANNSQWFIDDAPFANQISPVTEFAEKGNHAIKLTVVNEFGCSDDLYKYLKIENDYKLMASDKCSIGEGFMPKALKLMKRPFKLMIFDDNNVMVYETNDINKPWNCTLTNGNTAPVDSQFNWAVTLIDETGQEKIYGGNITLIP